MAANQDTAGHGDVIRESTGWLMGMQPPKGVKPPRRHEARSISMSVVAWWLSGVCRHCQGRRYDLVPGTQVVSENLCRTCFGAGREPVEHRVAREHAHAARWLANQYEDLMSYILADMARRLRSDMRFFASKQEGR